MKKTALLIDGGWFTKGLSDILKVPGGWPSAEQVRKNAVAALEQDEDLFRIFYYDSEPCDQTVVNPISDQVRPPAMNLVTRGLTKSHPRPFALPAVRIFRVSAFRPQC